MLQTCCASPSVLQIFGPLVLLTLNVPRTSTFKRAELLQTASGTLNNSNVGNVGKCCWRSDLSLRRVGTARTCYARIGDVRPWTTDNDDFRGSSSRQTTPLMCCFPRVVLVSLVMFTDGRDDFSRGYTITVCANGYAQQVAELLELSPSSHDGVCISWQPSGTLCCRSVSSRHGQGLCHQRTAS